MDETFNIRDVNLLIHMVLNNFHSKSNSTHLQTITPFIHLPGTGGDKDYEFNQKTMEILVKFFCHMFRKCVH
ncbi:hypothetical protein OQJ02_11965 [Legionella sp. PATHC032]|uniref:hypothetical protein n=1 Tax=Legionella sp. PATHC032 TaxID=2992039 RepID=UPI002242DBBD|nr:hypothetical protein [Legionella sp. PATHC032]MCW8422345.1 hypothetical protein [Legionella sp. PATHC032]